ncbi:MAG: 3-oxoadipate enol-lactonase [Sphingobium sp. 32-64-5]|nr:MAG: 3-oxoadipate enol-lactonase [Sphingobium sp. 32-64-5]
MAFLNVPGARLYWKREGRDEAPALVLLNSIGTDMDLWDGVLPHVRDHFSLLRIDTRGHGASMAEPGDYALGTLAADVRAVADAAGLGNFALAGVSLGGMIGMELALLHPDRGVYEAVRRQLVTMDAEGYAGCGAAIRDMTLADRIGAIGCPALVVTGTRDSSTPYAGHGEYLLTHIPGAVHHSLEAAHLAPFEAPEALAERLLSFL